MLSVAILTHNSQDTLPATLESVSFADEIVVVDDRSTDATVQVAKKYKAEVFTRDLRDDFARSRNFALSKCKGDWVLFVDSDETVSRELAEEIRTAVQTDTNDAYLIRRTNVFFGGVLRYGETAQSRFVRLGKRNAGVWERPVHEVWNVRGSIGRLHTPILHTPHVSVSKFLSDINRYSTINAGYFYDRGMHQGLWEIPVYPAGKFIYDYIFLLGFLDGMRGMIMAVMMSFHSFLTRAKLYRLRHPS